MGKFFEDVKKDLEEQEKLGISIPKNAYELLDTEDISEYEHMKVHEASDLIVQLAFFK